MMTRFQEIFSEYRDVPMAIYGIGKNAEWVLDHADGFRVVSLVAKDHIGESLYGKRVMALEEAVREARVIVIAATPRSTVIVHQRIKDRIPDDIPVFDMRGRRLYREEFYRNHPYWGQTKEKLYQAIDAHDVISFDVFDTLVMRRVLHPKDVFSLVEQELRDAGQDIPFHAWRVAAEQAITVHGVHYPTLDEIYAELQKSHGLPDVQREELCQCELAMEQRCLCARADMVGALRYAVEQGKRVFLTTDMYLERERLEALLQPLGIEGYEDVLISSACDCSKSDGRLFDVLREKAQGASIVHIGDNRSCDIEQAEARGLDAFYVMAAEELLINSSLAQLATQAETLSDRTLLGVILSHIFNSPFALAATKGKFAIRDARTMGQACFAGITMCYLAWMSQIVRKDPEAIVLFVSRDGYYLSRQYDILREKDSGKGLPENTYFYTSRDVATIASLLDEDAVHVLLYLLHTRQEMNLKEFLEARFSFPFPADFYDIKVRDALETYGYERIVHRVYEELRLHHEEICEKRERCQKYIDQLRLDRYSNIYVVDLITQGAVVYMLRRLLHRHVKLVAFGAVRLPGPYVPCAEDVYSLYDETQEQKDSFWLFVSAMEIIYASKDGQCADFDAEQHPVFKDGTAYRPELLDGLQEGMDDIFRDYSRMDERWPHRSFDKYVSSHLLEILNKQCSDIDEDVMGLFQFSDLLTVEKHMNILRMCRG